MKSFLSFLLFVCSLGATAQVPEPFMLPLQVIGGDGSDQVSSNTTKTPDGGLIMGFGTNSMTGPITESFCNSPSSRALFVKYNFNATIIEWSKCYKNSWGDTGYGYMFQTIDDKYVLGGGASSGNKWVIRKEDAAGNVLWTKAYGGTGTQQLFSMIMTDDGGYIMFGSAYSGDGDIGFHYGSAGARDFWVLKLNADGGKVWSKVVGGSGEELGASVVPAPGGGCYIVGSTSSVDYDCTGNHGSADVYVARLNADGDILWRRCLGGTGSDGGGEYEGCRAIGDGTGGVLIAARTGSADGDISHKINDPGNNIWLVNIDSSSNIVWDNCYGGGGTEYPNSLCRGTDGGIWIMGCSRTAGGQVNEAYGDKDAWIVHADSEGNFLNAKVLGSSGQDVGYMIYPLSDGSVIAGGFYGAGNGVFPSIFNSFIDAYLVKFANWPNNIKPVARYNTFRVYPNPAKDIVNIESSSIGHQNVVVNDITGRIVYNSTIAGNEQIEIGSWQTGVYCVQLTGADGQREVQKLIVQ